MKTLWKCSARKSKWYKRNAFSKSLHNFKHKTLWTTITVILFYGVSDMGDILTNATLHWTLNLKWLKDNLIPFEIKTRYKFTKTRYKFTYNQELVLAQKKEISRVSNDAVPASFPRIWVWIWEFPSYEWVLLISRQT